jgi:hypothetical protein
MSRPDIIYAIHQVAQLASDPTVDWAGCQHMTKLTSRVVVKMGISIVIWQSVKQKHVALSMLEVEYICHWITFSHRG